MNILFKTTVLAASLLLAACNNNDDQEAQIAPSTNSSKYYQTKTPYQPQQDLKAMNKRRQGSSQFYRVSGTSRFERFIKSEI